MRLWFASSVIVLTATATAATAQSYVYTAQTAETVRKSGTVIAAGIAWS